jgi:hypothetical protein
VFFEELEKALDFDLDSSLVLALASATCEGTKLVRIKGICANPVLFQHPITILTFQEDGTQSEQIINWSTELSEFAQQQGILELPVNFKFTRRNVLIIDTSVLSLNDTYTLVLTKANQKQFNL